MMYRRDSLPDIMKMPAGHRVVMETRGEGEITYKCRADKAMAGQYAWAFAGPPAKLLDRNGKQVGKYFGPPATREAMGAMSGASNQGAKQTVKYQADYIFWKAM